MRRLYHRFSYSKQHNGWIEESKDNATLPKLLLDFKTDLSDKNWGLVRANHYFVNNTLAMLAYFIALHFQTRFSLCKINSLTISSNIYIYPAFSNNILMCDVILDR